MMLHDLPNELFVIIFRYLTQRDQKSMVLVARRWYLVCQGIFLRQYLLQAWNWVLKTDELPFALKLLDLGTDIDRRIRLSDARDKQTCTLLHIAMFQGQWKLAKLLMHHDADVCLSDSEGRLPLYWAILHGNESMSLELSCRMADLQHCFVDRQKKYTPLHLACRMGFESLIDFYLVAGLDPCVVDLDGNTALNHAALCLSSTKQCFETEPTEAHRTEMFHLFRSLGQTTFEAQWLVESCYSRNRVTARNADHSKVGTLQIGREWMQAPAHQILEAPCRPSSTLPEVSALDQFPALKKISRNTKRPSSFSPKSTLAHSLRKTTWSHENAALLKQRLSSTQPRAYQRGQWTLEKINQLRRQFRPASCAVSSPSEAPSMSPKAPSLPSSSSLPAFPSLPGTSTKSTEPSAANVFWTNLVTEQASSLPLPPSPPSSPPPAFPGLPGTLTQSAEQSAANVFWTNFVIEHVPLSPSPPPPPPPPPSPPSPPPPAFPSLPGTSSTSVEPSTANVFWTNLITEHAPSPPRSPPSLPSSSSPHPPAFPGLPGTSSASVELSVTTAFWASLVTRNAPSPATPPSLPASTSPPLPAFPSLPGIRSASVEPSVANAFWASRGTQQAPNLPPDTVTSPTGGRKRKKWAALKL